VRDATARDARLDSTAQKELLAGVFVLVTWFGELIWMNGFSRVVEPCARTNPRFVDRHA